MVRGQISGKGRRGLFVCLFLLRKIFENSYIVSAVLKKVPPPGAGAGTRASCMLGMHSATELHTQPLKFH